MTEERARRKLSGILSADAVGYSRLMEEDEAWTIRTLRESKRLMSTLIEQFKGRVVDAPGDNLLAEFASVVDATECAVKIQKELKTKNAELPDNRKMEFRIGVNLGDVVEEAERIYGDGVNIAARIEGLAEPGGICISGSAFDQVKNKLKLGYEYLGEHSVKNIAEPVRVYRVLMEPEAAGKVIGEKRFIGRISRKTAMAAIIILFIVAGGLIGWNLYLQQSKRIEPASLDKMEYPLPDKPSIAVLPFDNIEYLCDGFAEEIITALSKTPKLFVIARNSTFTYKGKPVKVQQVAEELGVRYVLEGSVRRDAERLRVTAQLIDAISGIHLWAERYDRDLKDIFAIQDDITKRIISSLQVKLTIGEAASVAAKGTNSLEAYLKVMQAWDAHMRFTKEDNLISRGLAEEGISMDPQYGNAYILLAATYMLDTYFGDIKSRKQSLGKAIELAKKAVALEHVGGYAMLGWLYSLTGQHDKAIAECKKAVEFDPNSSLSRVWYGAVLLKVGRYEVAVQELEQAVRRDPMAGTWVLRFLGSAYSFTGRHDEAITTLNKAIQKAPNDYLSRLTITRAYIFAGRQEEAQAEAAEVLRLNPKFSLENYAKRTTGKDKERSLEAYRRAGLK
jgi:TolB-like protein/class 3 adenylate cyclase/Tfp pilus assembly protein PilF